MTSMELPGREMGQRAADMILEDIEDADDEKPSVQHMVFGTKLIERQRRKRFPNGNLFLKTKNKF